MKLSGLLPKESVSHPAETQSGHPPRESPEGSINKKQLSQVAAASRDRACLPNAAKKGQVWSTGYSSVCHLAIGLRGTTSRSPSRVCPRRFAANSRLPNAPIFPNNAARRLGQCGHSQGKEASTRRRPSCKRRQGLGAVCLFQSEQRIVETTPSRYRIVILFHV